MQDKDLHFCFGGVAEFGGIGRGNLYRNGDVAEHSGAERGERQYVGRFILAPILAVEFLHLLAAGDENDDVTAQSDRALRFSCKQRQRALANIGEFVYQEKHFSLKYKWEGTFSPPISW